MENDVLEIQPLQNVFAPSFFIDDYCVKEQINQSIGKLHLIKRSLQYFAGSDFYHSHKITKRSYVSETLENPEQFTLELAIFVDKSAYKNLIKFVGSDFKTMFNVMLVFVHLIQTLFYHPSLGVQIDIVLVRLELMKRNPKALRIFPVNRYKMLNSFCSYASNISRKNSPRDWDIALFLTGLQNYIVDSDRDKYYKSDEVCNRNLSCGIAAFFAEKLTESKFKRSSFLSRNKMNILMNIFKVFSKR